jgi:hypothetical protein
MGQLATPYRIAYQSKTFRTGVTGIVAFVLKPDNSMAGPFPLVEGSGPFVGNYFADFYTSNSDPEGEYIECVISTTEGIKSTKKFGMYLAPSADLAALTTIVAELQADLSSLNTEIALIGGDLTTISNDLYDLTSDITNLNGSIDTLDGLSKSLVSVIVPSVIKAVIPHGEIRAEIKSDKILFGIVKEGIESTIGDNRIESNLITNSQFIGIVTDEGETTGEE